MSLIDPVAGDLHLHSTRSDGDVAPREVVAAAKTRGVSSVSLTDHNGIWGLSEAVAAASELGLGFIGGIEITARFETADVHILGYSQTFDGEKLREGLASTRQGYRSRIQMMVEYCQAEGYDAISWPEIEASRANQIDPCYVSYDVAKLLQRHYQLTPAAARQLTVRGGVVHVPYGEWALPPEQVITLLHDSGGIAVLAHPGTIVYEAGTDVLSRLLAHLTAVGLDGIEAIHPFHGPELSTALAERAGRDGLLVTGGSDWHGPGRFHDASFGAVGVSRPQFAAVTERLRAIQ